MEWWIAHLYAGYITGSRKQEPRIGWEVVSSNVPILPLSKARLGTIVNQF